MTLKGNLQNRGVPFLLFCLFLTFRTRSPQSYMHGEIRNFLVFSDKFGGCIWSRTVRFVGFFGMGCWERPAHCLSDSEFEPASPGFNPISESPDNSSVRNRSRKNISRFIVRFTCFSCQPVKPESSTGTFFQIFIYLICEFGNLGGFRIGEKLSICH